MTSYWSEDLLRLEDKRVEDVEACFKQYYHWLDKYEDKMDYALYFQVYFKTQELEEVYNKRVLEKNRIIKTKSQNAPEEKSDEFSTEVDDLVDGEASHEAAMVTCGETVLELVQDQPITKFEDAAFAKYFILKKTKAARKKAFFSSQPSYSS